MAGEKHVRVPLTDLDSERLDTGFYAPDYFTARGQLRDSGLSVQDIGSFGEPWSFGAYALTSAIEWTRPGEGVPFFKAESLDSPLVDEGGLSFVTENTHRKLPKSVVGPGDIVVSTSGTVGRVAVVPASMTRANSNQDTIKFNPHRSDIDNYFLAAQLCCRFGQVLLNREAGGAVQQHVYLYNFKRIPLAIPNTDAQRYIGSKVRQAEALREWARSTERAARELYAAEVGKRGPTDLPYRQTFRTPLQERLDPEFYQPRYTGVLDAPWLVGASEPLGKLVVSGSYGCLPDSGTYGTGSERLLRATDLDGCGWSSDSGVRVPTDQIAAKALVGEGDVLLEVKGAMTRCVVAYGHAVGCYVNGTVYRFKASVDPWYLAVHLTGPIKQLYCARESVNNIILYLNLEAILSLPVIRLAPDVEGRIGGAFKRSVEAAGAARKLLTAARLLVEALIERKVTEAELIEAGKDPDADRALLSRLAEDGVDGAGAPLFVDLDGLAELIAEATADR
jgi:type I restriction enzyme S subunit